MGRKLGLLLSRKVTHVRELLIGRLRGFLHTTAFLLEGSESLRLFFLVEIVLLLAFF